MAIGAGIKFALNFVLLRVPQVGIAAAPIGSLACYLFIVAIEPACDLPGDRRGALLPGDLRQAACRRRPVRDKRLGELLSAVPRTGGRLLTLASISIGAIIYLILLFLLKIVTKDEFLLLPRAKKFKKLLKKAA